MADHEAVFQQGPRFLRFLDLVWIAFVPHAHLGPITVHLPERVETNEELQASFPSWDMKLIEEKTGIRQRHIAANGGNFK